MAYYLKMSWRKKKYGSELYGLLTTRENCTRDHSPTHSYVALPHKKETTCSEKYIKRHVGVIKESEPSLLKPFEQGITGQRRKKMLRVWSRSARSARCMPIFPIRLPAP